MSCWIFQVSLLGPGTVYVTEYFGPKLPLGRASSIGSGCRANTAGKKPACSARFIVGLPGAQQPVIVRLPPPPTPGPLIEASDGPLPSAAAGTARAATERMRKTRFIVGLLSRCECLLYTAPRRRVPALRAGRGGRADERLLEILDQIPGGLDPDGEPHEVSGCRERRIRRRRVGHAGRMLDHALHAAEALRELPDLRAGDELDRRLFRLDEERDHPAEVVHLPLRDLVTRVAGQAWVENRFDSLVGREVVGDLSRILRVPAHPDGERLQAPQHEPAVERARDGAERLLQEVEPFRDGRIVRRDESPDDIGVAAEVLRRRV